MRTPEAPDERAHHFPRRLAAGRRVAGGLLGRHGRTARVLRRRARAQDHAHPGDPAGGRRDPFTQAQKPSEESTRAKEPLEEFPLDSLKLIGLISFKNSVYALVRAPDGIVHRVTVGDHMGQNYGKITQITATEVSLVELVADGFGGLKQQPASLASE